MNTAYVDTSCLLAIALGEPTGAAVRGRFDAHGELLAANLLEAELRAACARESLEVRPSWMAGVRWVHPDRALTPEIRRTLGAGYLRGADLWHVAVTLFISPDPARLTFLTLDLKQRAVAAVLGFAT